MGPGSKKVDDPFRDQCESPAVTGATLDDDQASRANVDRLAARWFSPGALAILDQGLVSLNSFATMLLMARFCSKLEVTLYALAWSLFNVVRVIQERALGASYVVLVHQPQRTTATFTGSSLVHQALFSAAYSGLFLAAAAGLTHFGTQFDKPDGLETSLAVLAVAGPFVLLRDHLRILSGAHLKYLVAVGLNGSALALQMIFLLAFHHLEILSASYAFAAMGLASLVPVVGWLAVGPIPIRFNKRTVVPDWKATYVFSRWLIFARIFPTSSAALLPWIIFWTMGSAGAAAFATCLTLSNISSLLIQGANNFLQLKTVLAFNQDGRRGAAKVMKSSAGFYTALLVPIVFMIAFRGDWLMIKLFGAQYGGHQYLLSLLIVHTLLISFSTVFGNGMAAMDCPRGLFPGEVAYAAVAILAAYILSANFGLIGAGIAMCLAGAVSMMTSGFCFRASFNSQVSHNRQVSQADDAEILDKQMV